ncbi:MAG: NAD(P)/FAD-dependent oxidoreductase [Bacteroidia bacterium]|nr:NAD(P)/FAD-dependent oxidoreductase [Bacteroidia bacterium]
MNKDYDIVVIGGGHNGLTAATLLAKGGKSVLLLEKRDILGGIAAGEEFSPGYSTIGLLHDTSEVRHKVIKELKLETYGLSFKTSRPLVSILGKNKEVLHLSSDLEMAVSEIAKFSQKDAEAYREYRAFINKISPFINKLMDESPPDLMNLGTGQLWQLAKKGIALKKLGKKTMLEFLKVASMSVADFLNEKFETDFIKAGIAAPAIFGSYTGPWSSYTSLNLLLHECAAQTTINGGPESLISALKKASEASGVDIKTNSEVNRILLDDDRKVTGVQLESGEMIAASIVVSSCTPRRTFYEFLLPNQLDFHLENGIKNYRTRGTTAKVNIALNTKIVLNGETEMKFVRTGNSFDEMERAFDSVKYREFSKEPVLDIHLSSHDDSEIPSGHSVASVLVHFAPHHFDQGWSAETKKELLNATLRTLELYSADLSNSIVATEVLSPVDLENRYGLSFGHIFHGEHAIDQLITRPIPSCANYKTPLSGLYLCGSGSHPGGGITCMPGYLSAKAILKNN